MGTLRPCNCSDRCQMDTSCYQSPRFQVCLAATGRTLCQPVRRHTEACADHLGAMMQDMTRWAREHDLTDGDLTVLIVNPPAGGHHPGLRPPHGGRQTDGFIFSVIPLGA